MITRPSLVNLARWSLPLLLASTAAVVRLVDLQSRGCAYISF